MIQGIQLIWFSNDKWNWKGRCDQLWRLIKKQSKYLKLYPLCTGELLKIFEVEQKGIGELERLIEDIYILFKKGDRDGGKGIH